MRVMHVMAGAVEGGAENIMLESVLALAETDLAQHVVTRPDNEFRIQKFREAGIGVDVAAFNNSWPFPTRRVLGENIKLGWVVQATGTRTPLTKTSNPAPSGTQFWFDGYFMVRVGTAPASLDALTATYIAAL